MHESCLSCGENFEEGVKWGQEETGGGGIGYVSIKWTGDTWGTGAYQEGQEAGVGKEDLHLCGQGEYVDREIGGGGYIKGDEVKKEKRKCVWRGYIYCLNQREGDRKRLG